MKKLKRKGVGLEVIAMDMWPAYIKAVKKYYPEELIVFDRYHIIQECNWMLDELRRQEASKASLREKREVYIEVRHLLLKNWFIKAWSSEVELLVKFAHTLSAHRKGILNYFDHQITTGLVEGINNKVKVL